MTSTPQDLRGNPVGTRSPDALAAAEQALWRVLSCFGDPLPELDTAIAHDPAWLLPRVMKAGHLLSTADPARLPEARDLLDEAAALDADAPARERAHLAAAQQLLEGRWLQASQTLDELLLEHPRDALALHWAQLWDFYLGETQPLRHRLARALPEWDEHDPLHPFMLGLYAFALQENLLYPQAEEAGRRALAGERCVPWAVHAVAHVMELQGRFDDGAAWLRQHQPRWADGNGFACHLWWHLALFRLEGLDDAGVLRLVDAHLATEALQGTLQRVDAAALLWRLRLVGVDVTERFVALRDAWPMPDEAAGYLAANDLHALVALAGAGDLAAAERWLARCAERAMQPEDARRSNHTAAREVALPLMRGVLAFARGEHAGAAATLYPVRRQMLRQGGHQPLRDLIDQTLLAACSEGAAPALGRALLNERLMTKPPTPLTRHWAQRLGLPEQLPS